MIVDHFLLRWQVMAALLLFDLVEVFFSLLEELGTRRYKNVLKIRENDLVCQWGVDWSANPREVDVRLCRSSL